MKLKKLFLLLMCLTTSFTAGYVKADTNAGDVLRQIERTELPEIIRLPSQMEKTNEPEVKEVGEKIKVVSFAFKGNVIISTEKLSKHLKSYVDQELTIEELNRIVASISLLYKEQGYLAQATLPAQDITQGEITIVILEAHFGGARLNLVDSDKKPNVKASNILDMIYPQSKLDEPLNLNRLDRGVLLANDLPGIAVGVNLSPGRASGHTDIEVQIKNKPLIQANALIDNYGGRATGHERLMVFGSVLSPLGYGDQIDVMGLKSDGTTYGRIDYSIPVGSNGLRIGPNITYLEYKVITPEYKAIQAIGHTSGYGIQASYPIYRSSTKNFNVKTSYDIKNFKNSDNNNGVTSDYETRVFSTEFSGDYFDQWLWEGALNTAKLTFDYGKNDLNNSPNYTSDLANDNTNGNFNRLQLNFARNQFIKNNYNLVIKAAGQFATRNLDSSEKFYLGGASGVRAYPSGEGVGSKGYLVNFELNKDLSHGFNLTGFYDYGYVVKNADNFDTTGYKINALNAYSLKGYGFEINWHGPRKSNFYATFARRDGHNPNAATNGNDQDGSLKENVFLFRAMTAW